MLGGHTSLIIVKLSHFYSLSSPPPPPPQPTPIILLKEGTDSSQGKPQIISNINACEVIVDAVATTLGPRGMDKLIVDGHGTKFVILCANGCTARKTESVVGYLSIHLSLWAFREQFPLIL